MNPLKCAVILCVSLLSGMKTVYGIWGYQEREEPFWKVWNSKELYVSALPALIFYLILFMLGGNDFFLVRYAELLYTYLLLAVIDQKTRKVPDQVLFMFLAAQLLLAAAGGVTQITAGLAGNVIFAGIMILVAITSGGRMGFGDAKLLAVTAFVAGWSYTLAILCIAMLVSVLYGLWLLLFRHFSAKEEVPFVPFLCLGTILHLIYFINTALIS